MDPEYLAIIVTISVLGGVILIALLVVCIAKIAANDDLKDTLAETQLQYGDTMALQEAGAPPTYLHFPAPEPYTPVPYDSKDNPWRLGPYNDPEHEEHDPNIDAIDYPTYPYYPPAHHMPERSSHALGIPQSRSSYAPEIPRRLAIASGIQRSSSMADPVGAGKPAINQRKKLWYYYLKEGPDYLQKSLEESKKQQGVWRSSQRRTAPSPVSLHTPPGKEHEEVQRRHHHHYHHHHQQQQQQQPVTATRSNWM